MNVITSQTLQRAAELAQQIETLNPQLTAAQATVTDLTGQINTLQTELDGLVGNTGRKACRVVGGTRHFSDEQKAKISAGLKASWERRKAAKAAAAAVTPAPDAPQA